MLFLVFEKFCSTKLILSFEPSSFLFEKSKFKEIFILFLKLIFLSVNGSSNRMPFEKLYVIVARILFSEIYVSPVATSSKV